MSVYLGDKEVGISVVAFREETDPTVPQHVKDITQEDISNWNAGGDISSIQQQINDIEQNKASILYVDGIAKSLAGQNEYIGSYTLIDYTEDTIQTVLSYFVEQNTTPSREPRTGDIVNVVNGIYAGQQWIYNGIEWKYYIDFENHSVIDNLESDSVLDGLAARQGKQLKSEIDDINTNLTENYVKNTDISTTKYENNTYVGNAGLFLYDGGSVGGLFKSTAGGNVTNAMRLKKATFADINNRKPSAYHDAGVAGANHCCPIVPANFDYAFKRALLDDKLNGFVYDGVDYSWTDEEKAQARSFLGVPQFTATQLEDGSYSLTIGG